MCFLQILELGGVQAVSYTHLAMTRSRSRGPVSAPAQHSCGGKDAPNSEQKEDAGTVLH